MISSAVLNFLSKPGGANTIYIIQSYDGQERP